MDEATRLRMRRAHANHSEVCPCGRRVRGNGRKAHFRACRDYLTGLGYPLDDGMRRALYDAGLHAEQVGVVERRLGLYVLNDPAARNVQWREWKELVWRYADEAQRGSV